MGRENALMLSKIFQIEKERGRGIYPEELANYQICGKGSCKQVIDHLMENCLLVEETVSGANTYRVSNIGLAHMEAYLDIKREM